MACKVMHIAACLLKNVSYKPIEDYPSYLKAEIGNSKYSKLSKLRKFDMQGFAHVVKTIEILQE